MKHCPVCKKQAIERYKNESFPFCSERCRMIDLGDWLIENHKIPSVTPDEVSEVIYQDKVTKH
jgi:endogenous inhibitor of DNA gyrase (YacG/DUF329 family)